MDAHSEMQCLSWSDFFETEHFPYPYSPNPRYSNVSFVQNQSKLVKLSFIGRRVSTYDIGWDN